MSYNGFGEPPLDPFVERRIKELLRVYRNAGDRIERQLNKAALTPFQKYRYGQHLKQIQTLIAALNAEARDVAKGVSPVCYKAGAAITQDALERSGRHVVADLGNAIHTEALEAITDQMTLDLVSANGTLERSARRILRVTQQKAIEERQINDIIARGMVQGENRRDVSSRLAADLERALGKGVKVEINGRKFDPDYYAELVARTRTREAVTEGALRTGHQFGVTLFRVSVHDGACEMCLPYQGKVYSTVEGSGFPMLTKRPPFHPRCRHTLFAWVGLEDEETMMKVLSNSDQIIRDGRQYDAYVRGDVTLFDLAREVA